MAKSKISENKELAIHNLILIFGIITNIEIYD
jgi:hypothetical protein